MFIEFLPAFAQTAQQPTLSTMIQAIWIGLIIIFVFSVFAAGFTSKKIENIHEPTYSKAFLATLLKNMLGLTSFFIFGLFLQAPEFVAIGIAVAVVPIILYKIVFASMWREAALIWIVAFIVEVGVGYLLILAGLVSLGVFQNA